ncbi:MAG: hypothetical protein JSS69_06195 [Acidobacteria bacterium]|nr:hypothetical protein [Acidobacteriota bacterium]MBS1865493.1 hypothetical protein [Acidobacteriota bacterium]
MPHKLKRIIIGRSDLHFITFACYQRHPKDWPWSSWSAYLGKAAILPIDFLD